MKMRPPLPDPERKGPRKKLSAVDELVSALSGEKLPDAATLATLGVAAYNETVGEYRPLIEMLPRLADELGADAAPVVAALLKFIAALGSEDVVASLRKITTTRAKIRRQNFNAHVIAGFSDERAFELCKLDAASSTGIDGLFSILPKLASLVEIDTSEDDE